MGISKRKGKSKMNKAKIKKIFNGNGAYFYEIRNLDVGSLIKKSSVFHKEYDCVFAVIKEFNNIADMLIKLSITLPRKYAVVKKWTALPDGYMIYSIFGKIRVSIIKCD